MANLKASPYEVVKIAVALRASVHKDDSETTQCLTGWLPLAVELLRSAEHAIATDPAPDDVLGLHSRS